MKLKAERVGGDVLKSAALVFDTEIEDAGEGQIVAFVVYSGIGAVIYWHREGYDELEVLVAGETFMGEAFGVAKVKHYDATVRKVKANA